MRTGRSSGESNIPHRPKASRAAGQGEQETHTHIAGVMDLAELRWQKQVMANEVQNQRRLGRVCGEDGPHSKYDENTRSLQFFLILLYFGCCFLLFFPPSSFLCVLQAFIKRHLMTTYSEGSVEGGRALCEAPTCGKSRRAEAGRALIIQDSDVTVCSRKTKHCLHSRNRKRSTAHTAF